MLRSRTTGLSPTAVMARSVPEVSFKELLVASSQPLSLASRETRDLLVAEAAWMAPSWPTTATTSGMPETTGAAAVREPADLVFAARIVPWTLSMAITRSPPWAIVVPLVSWVRPEKETWVGSTEETEASPESGTRMSSAFWVTSKEDEEVRIVPSTSREG